MSQSFIKREWHNLSSKENGNNKSFIVPFIFLPPFFECNRSHLEMKSPSSLSSLLLFPNKSWPRFPSTVFASHARAHERGLEKRRECGKRLNDDEKCVQFLLCTTRWVQAKMKPFWRSRIKRGFQPKERERERETENRAVMRSCKKS